MTIPEKKQHRTVPPYPSDNITAQMMATGKEGIASLESNAGVVQNIITCIWHFNVN